MAVPSVPSGDLIVVLTCPRCGERSDVAVYVGGRLTVDDYGASLKPFLRSKAVVDHKCGQMRLEEAVAGLDPATPPMWDDDDDRKDRRRSGERD